MALPIIFDQSNQFGKSLETGLERLIQGLEGGMERSSQAKALQSLGMFSPEQAQNITQGNFDPKTLNTLLSNLGTQQKQQQFKQSLLNAGYSPEKADLFAAAPSSALKGLFTQEQQLSREKEAAEKTEAAREGSLSAQQEQAIERTIPELDTYENDLVKEKDNLKNAIRTTKDPLTKKSLRKDIKEVESQLKDIRTERTSLYGKDFKDLRDEAKAGREENFTLERLDELSDNALNNWWNKLLLGLDIENVGALSNPETEEFQKLSQSFLRGAQKAFGGRVSNFEVSQFMKSVPTLINSPEGLRRIAANMKRLNDMKIRSFKEGKRIKQENGGILPDNFIELLDDRLKPYQKKAAKEFKKDIKRAEELAKKEGGGILNKIAQATPGVVKTVAPIVGGGILGGVRGARLGIPGIIGGSLLGATGGSSLGSILKKLGG